MTEFNLTDWLDARAPEHAAEENPRSYAAAFAQGQPVWMSASAPAERPANEAPIKICIARDLI